MTNRVGILQHATYHIPNYHYGYCIDDNSRALILALLANERQPEEDHNVLITTYLSFIHYMQLENGKFRNFLSFSNEFLDEGGSEDAFGRTLWALGYLLQDETHSEFHPLALEIFFRALPHAESLISVRAIGYTLLGLTYYLEKHSEEEQVRDTISRLAAFLHNEYQQNSSLEWSWYEKIISYDNAILPLSLMRAARLLQVNVWKEIAMESFAFLDTLIFEEEYLSPIGNETWYRKGEMRSYYGQQPIEVTSTIMLYLEMYDTTHRRTHFMKAVTALQWFFGDNVAGEPIYDLSSKGCRDGLERYGINQNQGAESTISFWIAYLYFLKSPVGTNTIMI